jgi:hypothetical protein
MTWSPGGGRGAGERRRRRRPEVKWEKDMESVIKQKNLTYDEEINWQLGRKKTSNRWTTGYWLSVVRDRQTDGRTDGQTDRQTDR